MIQASISHSWERIEDLPANWESIARPDIDKILSIWRQERASLRDPSRVSSLNDRLATRWAIETGIIERLYTMDRGITESLVEQGLEAIERFSTDGRITRNVGKLIEDQRTGLEFVFSYIKDERALSLAYIKELHQLLLRNQETTEAVTSTGERIEVNLLKGAWKQWPNNPLTPDGSIHEYCPVDFVPDEMEMLLRLHEEHRIAGVRPEVEAAWLHHRFTQIHPFQDGNGRVARALATMVFLKEGFVPLVVRNDDHRDLYLDALATADRGDLGPLISLFANIETSDLNGALTYVREIRGEGISTLAKAAANTLKRRNVEDDGQLLALTEKLLDITFCRFREVEYELQQAFQEAGVALDVHVNKNDELAEGWWQNQIITAARKYQYYADLSRFRRWCQLRLVAPSASMPKWHIVVSFHHKESRANLMAATAFLSSADTGFEDQRVILLGSENEFTFSTVRDPEIEFRTWLEAAITRLLEDWQSRL